MLADLSSHLDSQKYNELVTRLNQAHTKTALAAEAELLVLWGLSQVACITIEPSLPYSSSRPEAETSDLFDSTHSVIEVRALSDDSFSGKEAMDRTANIIASYADRIRTQAGSHLYFEFCERSYWADRFHRGRCVDPRFQLSTSTKNQLRQWIRAPDWPTPESIRIQQGKTDLWISWAETTVLLHRTHCRMPPVAYSLEDNPVYKALKKKNSQLKGAEAESLRCIFLVDAGCSLLRRLGPVSGLHEVSGGEIIHHALSKLSIDIVVVLSPHRVRQNSAFEPETRLAWKVTYFDEQRLVTENAYERLTQMAEELPIPRFEGYQARDFHKQGRFAQGQKDWHLPTDVTWRLGGKLTIKLSSSLLHKYLAGEINPDEFREKAFNNYNNDFALALSRDSSIRNVEFESGGLDMDDDYVVFKLDTDWRELTVR